MVMVPFSLASIRNGVHLICMKSKTSSHSGSIMRTARMQKLVLALALGLTASGCTSLPSNGPTVGRVLKDAAQSEQGELPYKVVPLDISTVQSQPENMDVGLLQLAEMARDQDPIRADIIHIGDVLSVTMFEIGVSLFGNSGGANADPTRAPLANAQTFTAQVREDGNITLPYIGVVQADGHFPEAVAAAVRKRLAGLSEHPDVIVTVADSMQNAVYVSGAVSRPGRVRLSSARERLLDILTLAGGSPLDINELQVKVVRGNREVSAPLNEVSVTDAANLRLHAGDRVILDRVRRTFTVFGATDRINQIPFESRTLTLAEALARSSGPSDARANPQGVFLFRLQKGADGSLEPVVYRIDMLKADTYFLTQMFKMRDKDVILYANSSSNLAQKMVSLLNLLFSPALTVRYATQ